ncbi:MAG: tRNA (adenosine(37)-N6)-threonylcarbamoyltransferase complex dimerization subunit type 1 TsaB, partial [Proteobacteria bacterium]|nr:tRNA (adenosine(37)-N6)-threonylcarbamoyltransferase complex dimerization subunit type 1 TsaB [Pseudomonadota bacterium]
LPAHPARIAGDGARSALEAFAASASLSGLGAPALCAAGFPDAAMVAALAAVRAETHVAAEPIYLRGPDVTPEPAGGKVGRTGGGPG